ncbi:MAG TPA: BatA domain-containing protein, partial [Planctomycetota bacterium]|nr:BatA domain-containing protein [Planctomycetota bacterium]
MFLHPGLAALGIGLVAVPIVIHLLNRRRFQIVRFGAMDFLRNAYRRTRRRLELENLLLLLLRALAVLLLGLAIARPSLDSQPPLIGNVGGARRDVVLALDASWSMGWRDGGSSSYDRGVAAARAILETLKPERQDRASLILAKRRPLRLSSTDVGKARDELSRHAEPSFEGMDLAATLDLVANEVDALDPDVPPEARNVSTTLYFLTDLQRSTFTPRAARAESSPAAGSSGPSPLQTAMAALAARKVAVRVIDVGPSGDGIPDNAGVVSVTSGDELAPVGAPVELRVAVRNFGSSPRTAATLTPTVDGDRQAVQTLDLPAAQEREIVVPLTFRESGDHAVEIALEEDRLGADDRRSFAIHVRPALRVLLVDGADQPDADPELSATGM